MSHTEQMREALEKIDLCLSQGNQYQARVELRKALMSTAITAPAAEPEPVGEVFIDTQGRPVPKLYGNVSLTDGVKLYAAATAAEVPEAMGDAEINSLRYLLDVDDYDPNMMKFASAILRHRDAQWQSTRLRGGVPDIKHVCMQVAENPEVEDALSHYVNDDSDTLTIAWLVEVILKHALEAAPQAPAAALDAGGVRDAERYMGLTEAHDAIDAAMNGGSHG